MNFVLNEIYQNKDYWKKMIVFVCAHVYRYARHAWCAGFCGVGEGWKYIGEFEMWGGGVKNMYCAFIVAW